MSVHGGATVKAGGVADATNALHAGKENTADFQWGGFTLRNVVLHALVVVDGHVIGDGFKRTIDDINVFQGIPPWGTGVSLEINRAEDDTAGGCIGLIIEINVEINLGAVSFGDAVKGLIPLSHADKDVATEDGDGKENISILPTMKVISVGNSTLFVDVWVRIIKGKAVSIIGIVTC